MSTYTKKIQEHIEQYSRESGGGPIQPRDVALWMVQEGLWAPPLRTQVSLLANDISDALRTQYFVDDQGRRVRKKHAVKSRVKDENGKLVQQVLWFDIDIAPPQFMAESFSQRRTAIADECWQLKQDIDHFNENLNHGRQIQTWFDFSDDVADREAALTVPA
jgi:hypothetical protein